MTAHRPGCWLPNPNRLLGLYAAITRATLDGKNLDGWIPEEKITLPEAVEAYTMGSAFVEFQEKEKGCITPRQTGRHGYSERQHIWPQAGSHPQCEG